MTDEFGRTIPVAEEGRAEVIKIGELIEDCLNDVPLHPATTPPEKSSQSFQSGDVVSMNHKYTFENTQVTIAGGSAKAASYRALVGKRQEIQLGDGFTGWGIVYVSTGPTLVANGTAVPTISLTIEWLTTIDPKTGDLVHPADVDAE